MADDAADRLAKARELLAVTVMDDNSEKIFASVIQALEGLVVAANPGHEELVRRLLYDKMLPEMKRQLPSLREAYAGLYAETFTLAELEETVTFYRSPAGQKWIQSRPGLMQHGLSLGQAWGEKMVLEALRELEPEFRKKGLAMPSI